MQRRLAMTVFIAAILGGAAFSAFRVPWFHATRHDFTVGVPLTGLEFEHMGVLLVALLVNLYFFVRLVCTGILLLNGGPTSTSVIAWYTPLGAHVQGLCSLVAAVVMVMLTPTYFMFDLFPTTLTRSWGGALLITCNLLAQIAIRMIARDPALAKTQTWVDDDGVPVPKRKRWIRTARKERPLVKPPLSAAPNLVGDPFRDAPPTGVAAAIVKPPTKIDAPRKDDDAAPAPKLLV